MKITQSNTIQTMTHLMTPIHVSFLVTLSPVFTDEGRVFGMNALLQTLRSEKRHF